MMEFKTHKEMEEASLLIGAEIQNEGRKKNPSYVCEKWARGEEIEGLFYLPYTPIADELDIKYTLIEE